MGKDFYKKYSIHMLQYYIQTPEPTLQTKADRLNRQAAEATISELSGRDKDIITRVFGGLKRLEYCVDDCSIETGISQPEIWHVIKRTCRRVAELRGLI